MTQSYKPNQFTAFAKKLRDGWRGYVRVFHEGGFYDVPCDSRGRLTREDAWLDSEALAQELADKS